MNNKIVCVLQENANILHKYICYCKLKQVLSDVLKYGFTQGVVSVKVNKINRSWFRFEATLLRNYCSTYISKSLTMQYLKLPFTVIFL